MTKRTYSQLCGIARALDIVGERWTLLIVRELLTGPKRFKDLLDGMPGVSPNLLSIRLREMESDGLLAHGTLPPPASIPVYELTALGHGLEPVIVALGRWGFNFMEYTEDGFDDLEFTSSGFLLGMKTRFDPQRARGLDETYEIRVDGEPFHFHVANGAVEAAQGHARQPAATLIVDQATVAAMGFSGLTLDAALATGRAHAEGDLAALARCFAIFASPPATLATPAHN